MSNNGSGSGTIKSRHQSSTASKPASKNSSENLCSSATSSCMLHTICQTYSYFCRRIIFGPAVFKIVVAFTIIILGSFLKALGFIPSTYFSSKKNILNVYFAKFGWGWTIGLLIPFIYLTLMKFHSLYDILTRHLVRILIATGVWFIITNSFVHLESYTGYCTNPAKGGLSKRLCLKDGHEWQEGFDISGHTFLLFYAILIINEEIKLYDAYIKSIEQINNVQSEAAASSQNVSNKYSKQIDITIKIFYVLLAKLTILWEFMLLSTALYFHDFSSKVLAGIFATGFWYVTYHLWYSTNDDSILRPLPPKGKQYVDVAQ